jgi:hypothetical protein
VTYHPVARPGPDGQLAVHVLSERSATCIFRPGNLMDLRRGRVRGMVDEAVQAESCIPCHATIYGDAPAPAVCRGFYDAHGMRVWPLRWAAQLGRIVYIDPPSKEDTPA